MRRRASGKIAWSSWIARDIAVCVVLATFSLASRWSPVPNQAPENSQASQPRTTSAATQPDQPSQAAQDRELARKIRRALVTDKKLSTSAHNVKIIAQNGIVTLQGPVESEDEKNAVTAKAAHVAGERNVKDELTVKSKT